MTAKKVKNLANLTKTNMKEDKYSAKKSAYFSKKWLQKKDKKFSKFDQTKYEKSQIILQQNSFKNVENLANLTKKKYGKCQKFRKFREKVHAQKVENPSNKNFIVSKFGE